MHSQQFTLQFHFKRLVSQIHVRHIPNNLCVGYMGIYEMEQIFIKKKKITKKSRRWNLFALGQSLYCYNCYKGLYVAH